MRRLLLLSLLVNAVALGIGARAIGRRGGLEYLKDQVRGAPGSPPSIDPDLANYLTRQTLFERLPERKGALVFAGDSITANCEWGELYPGAVNRGIGGDTSEGLLKRIGSITKLKPRAVFLMIGTNDQYNMRSTPERSIANIRAIVAQIRRDSPETPVYLQSIIPRGRPERNPYIQKVNAGIATLGDGKSVIYIDLYSDFLENGVLSPKFSFDGDHLNGEGVAHWNRRLQPFISQLTGSP